VPRPQLPVYSPVTVGALAAAFAVTAAGGARARSQVEARLRAAYAPTDMLLVDSGTSALTLALAAVRFAAEAAGRSPLVALPAYGCFDLATAAVGAGVRVVLYDLDPATLGPAWPSLEAAIAVRPDAVVVAHLYGVPVDVARVARLASQVDAVVVDDAAQGVGASIGGRPLGALGSLGVLSFGRGKGRTGGGGGALLANDARGADLLALVRPEVGAAPRGRRETILLGAQWLLGRPSLYWIPASLPFLQLGATPYHAPHAVVVMPDACAAALAESWEESEREVLHRRAVAARWRRVVPASWALPESAAVGAERGELRLPALVPEGEAAEDVARRVGGGVMMGYPLPLTRLPALAASVLDAPASSGAEALTRRLVTLPCHRHAAVAETLA
jgi:dTDP-4-amino-4,6-dideoxygalactose transaminase